MEPNFKIVLEEILSKNYNPGRKWSKIKKTRQPFSSVIEKLRKFLDLISGNDRLSLIDILTECNFKTYILYTISLLFYHIIIF